MSSTDWITTIERREKIIKHICMKRNVTMQSLADEFGVTIRTIRRDIEHLSLSYPLENLRGRYDGGVRIHSEFYLSKKYLNTEQINLLEKIKRHLPTSEVVVINSILSEFSLSRSNNR